MGNVRRRIASWLNLVVRTHVLVGRLDHACGLLEELCAALPKCIHRSTYRILLSELRAVHRIGRYNAIAALAAKHLPAHEWQTILESLGDLISPEASVFSLTSSPSVSLVSSVKPSKTVENHMPSRLHRLRKTIRSRDPRLPLKLARFMQDYLNLGRTRALSLLYRRLRRLHRNSNIPPSPSPTVLWATAEMVLFRNQGLPVMAIQAIAHTFVCTVSLDEILRNLFWITWGYHHLGPPSLVSPSEDSVCLFHPLIPSQSSLTSFYPILADTPNHWAFLQMLSNIT
ncbi:hypothetical protein BS47DRAFT_759905 [Hydnum rufescens UP504]|uniref:Uncharacterized protein n=1 Tax=Hydnum rufescens UP504 TaxID=1448309 RepID=A0A9P6BAP4_9AGAM|nr:hypothetical protein BS47DRAFT_759905 [Hydnum rufescens UP504]